jgi:hypothetical protein
VIHWMFPFRCHFARFRCWIVLVKYMNLLYEKKSLERHFLDFGIINQSQFGFRKSSTLSACSQLVHKIQTYRDGGNYVSYIFIDIWKAFDSVSHSLLLHKLRLSGVGALNLKTFESFLNERRQFLQFGFLYSMKLNRGSLLGLIFFYFIH